MTIKTKQKKIWVTTIFLFLKNYGTFYFFEKLMEIFKKNLRVIL